MLFVADRALTAEEICAAIGEDSSLVEHALEQLREQYEGRGVRIMLHGDSYQMCTAPEASIYCQKLLGLSSDQKLTQASLETLAIIAYNQPATRAEIERIRGVNSDSPFSLLVNRGLITPVGRGDQAGRPILYGTTSGFLAYFGIGSLDDLPDVELPEPQA